MERQATFGLELGADDYICKPFSPREVVARVKTVLRRSDKAAAIQVTGLQLDEARYKATLDGTELELTAAESSCCNFLLRVRDGFTTGSS